MNYVPNINKYPPHMRILSTEYGVLSTEQDKESTEYNEESTEYDEESTEYNNESTEYNEISTEYDEKTYHKTVTAFHKKNLFHESYQLQNVNKKLDRTVAKKFLLKVCNIYLLLTEFEVRTVSYGPSFFPLIYGPSAKRTGHKSTGKNKDP